MAGGWLSWCCGAAACSSAAAAAPHSLLPTCLLHCPPVHPPASPMQSPTSHTQPSPTPCTATLDFRHTRRGAAPAPPPPAPPLQTGSLSWPQCVCVFGRSPWAVKGSIRSSCDAGAAGEAGCQQVTPLYLSPAGAYPSHQPHTHHPHRTAPQALACPNPSIPPHPPINPPQALTHPIKAMRPTHLVLNTGLWGSSNAFGVSRRLRATLNALAATLAHQKAVCLDVGTVLLQC